MGFGTGLNALMSCKYAEEHSLQVNYNTIEKEPLVNFDSGGFIDSVLELNSSKAIFSDLHRAQWQQTTILHPYFLLYKNHADIFKYREIIQSDIIYYDAFAPSAQPELWSTELMHRMYQSLKPNGIIITYCAQGQFKRNLNAAGFVVESLPGPSGKREITRGVKL